ncbi:DNA-binding protein [archaeon]|nr:DNA-binding protein [archaeon]|tara:strand:+ start:914 stop:1495 length:582 start_codon:yes stop_codon:yes gene_type:complete
MERERPARAEPKKTEEYAIVLDYLKHGYASEGTGHRPKSPICQAIGKTHLTLLELVPKNDVFLQPHQEVYIGEGKREQIHHIKGRIPFDRLTTTAAAELKHVVEKIVTDDESQFVTFFNKAQPLSMRMHQLELLPGLGKKHMWEILDARKEKPFESFADLRERVKLLPDPKTIIIKRILSEAKGKEKYNLFVR